MAHLKKLTQRGRQSKISNVKLRINQAIRASKVMLIGSDGMQLGETDTQEALEQAESEGLDLVEVNPNADVPVCRIMDYGKFKYRQTKKVRESKKKQHVVKQKEVKLRPSIDVHDCQIKLENAKKFLEKGCKVKVTLLFRGREMAHKEIGETVLKKFCQDLLDTGLGAVEVQPKLMGRTMTLVIGPNKTK